ncbi:pentatricopeptide repeat-containing protein At2g33760 [Selaginella moellendorffii]|uniref:pentatricopeptide repeat-containing protein At2g33760 n=1 Tax=Selaginella moellendorffii TaxID=88036 RepID=UPI000D1C56A2|nr:pentatricopeptide repeat-containing protein At2g33760 [Selaginella moellendorffii]|eukprot:XP_024514859.1 pentatricopeptide repeat-containing protein At2g33760 [Selaginella moellendorffii]
MLRQCQRGKGRLQCLWIHSQGYHEQGNPLPASDCERAALLGSSKIVHAQIAGSPVENLPVEIHGDAAAMAERSPFSWNLAIAEYARNGHHARALEIFRAMALEGVAPDRVSCIAILDAFASLGDLSQGEFFHRTVCEASGLGSDVVVATAVLTMYNRCGSVIHARRAFDAMVVRNVVSWSAMIAAYAQRGHPADALELFVRMDHEGVKANAITFVSVLDACASLGAIALGKSIHERIVADGLLGDDVILGNTIVNMYGKCGEVDLAREVFERMEAKNTVTWNTMIAACSRHDRYKEAFALLGEMDLDGLRPNKITLVSVIDACAWMQSISRGRIVHEIVAGEGLESDNAVANALVNLYGKCGKLRAARHALEGIETRDKISWTTLLAAYARHGHGKRAIAVIKRMDHEGVKLDSFTFVNLLESCVAIAGSGKDEARASSEALALGEEIHDRLAESGIELDPVLQTALVDMYGKCGNPDAARRAFDRMRDVRDVTVWNALLAAYVLRDQGKETLGIFARMSLQGVAPDAVTFLSILDACASLAALGLGRLTHSRMLERGLFDRQAVASADLLTTSVINMYAKCGSLADAKAEFAKARRARASDVVAWSAMVAAYSQFGLSEEALRCFYSMQQEGVKPDSVSFVSAIAGCSHSGLVREAVAFFTSLRHDHGIAPTEAHFACLVDLLSRAGWIREAEALMRRAPLGAHHSTWMTLLSACRTYGDLERARRVAARLASLRSGSAYSLLASVFCLSRKWDDVRNARQSLVERGFITQPGCSWIEINNRVYEFFAGDDRLLPREEEIFAELERLCVEIRKAGYERDPIKKVHDHGEQEKKFLLSYHSEKVAVVFGLISTPEGTPLRIVKNIGVCQDCHEVIKCISEVADRVITLRDDRSFHQFSHGSCSCKYPIR